VFDVRSVFAVRDGEHFHFGAIKAGGTPKIGFAACSSFRRRKFCEKI